jgi:tetratricopeptide (TPR) repeat protein
MSDPQILDDNISRLMQEAEFYEQQGLFDQAVVVYRNVLKKEPDNRKAQAKVVEIQFSRRGADRTEHTASEEEDLSPRLALDLGIAYMGMHLYLEALEQFRKALKPGPVFRLEILRYTAICLIHTADYSQAETILGHILQDRSATLAEKCDIVTEILNTFVLTGAKPRAQKIARALNEAQKELVADCQHLLRDTDEEGDLYAEQELVVEDTETGLVYTEPFVEEPTEDVGKTKDLAESIAFRTPVSYSTDSKRWKEAVSSHLSDRWAVVEMPEDMDPGESLVLQITLPIGESTEKVWVIAKIALKTPAESIDGTWIDFVSFLPGGESILKGFIEEALNPPTPPAEKDTAQSTKEPVSIFAALEEEAIKAFEVEMLAEPAPPAPPEPTIEVAQQTPRIRPPLRKPEIKLTESTVEQPLRIRFACECGQVHVVPINSVGRKGKCGACGRNMTVPVVDMRPDSLSGTLIGQTVGGCRLLYKIGGGGMGGVFRGHHIALDIPVAVKILHAHLAEKDPVFIKRFIREARAAAKLQHPNIVGVMNVGFENGLHFLVMPYIGGGSAAYMLARHGRFRLEKMLHVAIDIARALTVAEEQGMLHRDIKPANIIFTTKGDAMLADLGLAKNFLESQDSGITQSGIACGTPLYFSPEQAKGSANMDIRSDIYSLGITLYHLLEGSPPFKGESAYVIFQKHVHEPLPPFKDADPPVPDVVFAFLIKMTAKDPRDRYASAQELLEALEELRDNLLRSGKPKKKRGLLERLGFRRSKD